jgi:hypothetical protein
VSHETARLIHLVALGAGVLVWLVALRFHFRAFRRTDDLDPEVLAGGEEEVAAPRGAVRDRVVEALRSGGSSPFSSVLIEEATDRRIAGRASALPAGHSGRRLAFEIELTDQGSATRGAWRVRGSGSSGLKVASGVFVFLLAPAALAAAAFLIPAYILKSDDPSVRGQALQTLQVVHFLWPPFLFGALYRRNARMVGTMLENVLRNAAF